jgi:hypothetical protein
MMFTRQSFCKTEVDLRIVQYDFIVHTNQKLKTNSLCIIAYITAIQTVTKPLLFLVLLPLSQTLSQYL